MTVDHFELHGWRFEATKLPILSSAEVSAAESKLGLPLPEICFGNNSLRLQHDSTGLALRFDALEALAAVDSTGVEAGTGTLKVAHAKLWESKRSQTEGDGLLLGERPQLEVIKPFDWTYSSTYAGVADQKVWEAAPPKHPGIPLARLADTSEPILFFNQVTLYEDELHDNGMCDLVVRIRVMSYGFFILQRFFLRVDGVIFRIFDTRVYHAFDSGQIIRETRGRQAPYDQIKALLPSDKKDDLTPLTDSNWVGQQLGMLEADAAVAPAVAIQAADPQALWKGLAHRLEVLKL